MKKLLLFVFFAFLLSMMGSPSLAQSKWEGINNSEVVPADVDLKQSNIQHTRIRFSLDGFKKTPLETPRGVENMISVDKGVQILEKGKPDLAKLATSIIIPDLDEMEINVVNSKYQEYTDVEVAPSKGHFDRSTNPDDVPFVYGKAYETDEFWPGKLAQLEEPFIMRDFRGQTITISPFQYNPVTKTLKVYTEIEVEITSTGKKGENPLNRVRDEITLEPEFGKIYDRFFINMDNAKQRYTMLEGEEGSLLIICYDDFMEEMQPFVDWKRTIGREAEIVSTSVTGTTATDIKNYVEDYYDDNDDFAYLLLVGDATHIATHDPGSYGGGSDGGSDNYYTFLVGNNSYNDIFIGRFSGANASHIETQVQRMIEYERDIDESDTWLNFGMGVARDEGDGGGHHGEADYVHMEFIKDTLLNYTYDVVHSEYDHNATGFPNTDAATITGNINDGLSIINYCNHGSNTGWSVAGYNESHVNNDLTNVGKLPFIWSVACVNGNFVYSTCFAETWLRATHNGEPSGAVGMLASTINQAWQPPMCGQDEMNSILTEESITHGSVTKRTFGGISANGSMFMIPQYNGAGTETHETWTLFGDPTLMVRTDVPTPFTADYPAEAMIGWDSFTVTSIDDGAMVALTKENNDGEIEIMGTAVASGGNAEIIFEETLDEVGVMTLAITGFNKVTYIEEVEIIAAGAYANFSAEPREILIGESVTFTDTSDPDDGSFSSWSWSFGDGADPATYSGENPPAVTYNTPGQKTVSLTVNHSTEGNLERVRENYITVNDIVTLTVNINGSGTVQVDGSEYNEPIELAENSTVSLEAIPDDLWHFEEWSGDLSGVYASTNLVMDENKTITANFIDCSGMTLPFAENFNASSELPVCWEIADHQGNDQVWQIGDPGHLDGTTGNYAYLDSDNYGSGNSQNSDLVTPLLDLSNYTDVEISFTHYYRDYQSESANLSYSTDGGETWNQVEDWGGNTTDNPATYSQVIDEVAGEQAVQFKWNYTGAWGYYWNVDDIEVTGTISGPYANFTAEPTTVYLGETVTFTDASGGGEFTEWEWNFGDGAEPVTATGEGPHDVTYNTLGSKTVSLTVDGEYTEIKEGYITVEEEGVYPYTLYENWQDFTDFTTDLSLNGWTAIDVHGQDTWGSQDYDFPGETSAFAYMTWNPDETDPPADEYPPVDGDKYVISVQSNYPENTVDDKWLISPKLSGTATTELSFYAKSMTDQYGLERFRVLVSTTGTEMNDFTQISEGDYIQAPTDWQYYEFDLGEHVDGEHFHFAIQRVSDDAFIMMVDAINVDYEEEFLPGDINGDGIVNVLDVVLMVNLILDGEYHPAGDLTDPEGEITTSDLTALVNIIMGYDRSDDHINSEPAFISLADKQIGFESDGTVAAILFEIEAENAAELKPVLNSSEHKLAYKNYDNKLRAIVYSTNNTPMPENTESLLTLEKDPVNMQWGELDASNVASGSVDLFSKTVTGLDAWDVSGLDVNVYPNPNKGEFVVAIKVDREVRTEISMFDVMGRKILSKTQILYTESNNEIKIDKGSTLNRGFYILHINGFDNQNDELIFTEEKKVIIQY